MIAEATQPGQPGNLPGFEQCEWKVEPGGGGVPGTIKVRLGTGAAIAAMQEATGQLQAFPEGAAVVPGARYNGTNTVAAMVKDSYVEVTLFNLSYGVNTTLAAVIKAVAARL